MLYQLISITSCMPFVKFQYPGSGNNALLRFPYSSKFNLICYAIFQRQQEKLTAYVTYSNFVPKYYNKANLVINVNKVIFAINCPSFVCTFFQSFVEYL